MKSSSQSTQQQDTKLTGTQNVAGMHNKSDAKASAADIGNKVWPSQVAVEAYPTDQPPIKQGAKFVYPEHAVMDGYPKDTPPIRANELNTTATNLGGPTGMQGPGTQTTIMDQQTPAADRALLNPDVPARPENVTGVKAPEAFSTTRPTGHPSTITKEVGAASIPGTRSTNQGPAMPVQDPNVHIPSQGLGVSHFVGTTDKLTSDSVGVSRPGAGLGAAGAGLAAGVAGLASGVGSALHHGTTGAGHMGAGATSGPSNVGTGLGSGMHQGSHGLGTAGAGLAAGAAGLASGVGSAFHHGTTGASNMAAGAMAGGSNIASGLTSGLHHGTHGTGNVATGPQGSTMMGSGMHQGGMMGNVRSGIQNAEIGARNLATDVETGARNLSSGVMGNKATGTSVAPRPGEEVGGHVIGGQPQQRRL